MLVTLVAKGSRRNLRTSDFQGTEKKHEADAFNKARKFSDLTAVALLMRQLQSSNLASESVSVLLREGSRDKPYAGQTNDSENYSSPHVSFSKIKRVPYHALN